MSSFWVIFAILVAGKLFGVGGMVIGVPAFALIYYVIKLFIQQKLETALSRILGEEIEITGSGRTDAGTHAACQVANFHCNSVMSCDEILSQLRRYLPEDIGIYSCRNVSERFHARLNAKTKTYRYRVWNSEKPCIFDRKYVYIDPRRVDISK